MLKAWLSVTETTQQMAPRGAAAVGLLSDLAVQEQIAVLILRQWFNGAEARGAISQDLIRMLGREHAANAERSLAHLINLMVNYGRRPLMHHDLRCSCLGGDESTFAHLIAAASVADHEEAMAFALTIMPAAVAYEAVQTAETLGFALYAVANALKKSSASDFENTKANRCH